MMEDDPEDLAREALREARAAERDLLEILSVLGGRGTRGRTRRKRLPNREVEAMRNRVPAPRFSNAFRETFLSALPRGSRRDFAAFGERIFEHSLENTRFDPPAGPFNRALLTAALLDLEYLEELLRNSIIPEEEAQTPGERRLAKVAAEGQKELLKIVSRLDAALHRRRSARPRKTSRPP